jgi:cellulose synthase/poly-beta-1,6-N-acetylglucosamine synthase-like glycosyltransferase
MNDILNKSQLKNKENYDTVVIAILAKDKGHVLPFYLDCILNQTYPKNKIHLYIRTNDNTDNTIEVLNEFVKQHHKQYASTYFDKRSVSDELKKYSQHEWNTTRFKILGKIRQESIDYAIKKNAHYFVIDCDNFILPHTLEKMVNMKHLNVIAPMLVTTTAYSNFHYDIDNNGYLKDHEMYLKILNKEVKGVTEVKVIHCTYFINNSILNKIYYDDNSFRYEYVIFSDCLRKANIPQYLDNRMDYGYITFSETKEQYLEEYNTHFRNMF